MTATMRVMRTANSRAIRAMAREAPARMLTPSPDISVVVVGSVHVPVCVCVCVCACVCACVCVCVCVCTFYNRAF